MTEGTGDASYRRGVARIPTWSEYSVEVDIEPDPSPGVRPRPPLRQRLSNMRTGSGWTIAGSAVLLVSWVAWASEIGVDQIATSGLMLAVIVGVAIGLFGLCRLIGSIVLEGLMKRTRRGAVLSHLAIGLFLALAGLSLLQHTQWATVS
ncbi:hypothetical protein Rhe02_05690 [Rhizocola hellebori]|uniref:Uncharacterized protein n=1 Tax=Rhizocola hellebori TaxID=1392758 RepID=A0A8J3VDJ0_9ACTN|nr:hypothetical protein [Rhizocola hellebori]GIH02502.1 hypothetical protein Rhe02_05690 [Rhizocola hellebori]